jgi:hypothetical protein
MHFPMMIALPVSGLFVRLENVLGDLHGVLVRHRLRVEPGHPGSGWQAEQCCRNSSALFDSPFSAPYSAAAGIAKLAQTARAAIFAILFIVSPFSGGIFHP